jgi:hypothetical protein
LNHFAQGVKPLSIFLEIPMPPISDAEILYGMYRSCSFGTVPWDELRQEEKNTWEDLADDLAADGWEPTI